MRFLIPVAILTLAKTCGFDERLRIVICYASIVQEDGRRSAHPPHLVRRLRQERTVTLGRRNRE